MTSSNNSPGDSELNCRAARCYSKINDYSNAQRYYLRSNKPDEFSEVIIKWAKYGYPNERDLFIARAVLQYLCIGNIRDSNQLFNTFIKNYSPAEELPQTPLMNFLRFLLATVERDALPLFELLRDKYKLSLARDPSFNQYLDHISHVFWGVNQPQTSTTGLSGFLGDFLKNFLDDGESANSSSNT